MNQVFSQHSMLFFLLAAAWLLSACSISPVGENLSSSALSPENLTHWQITGKIAYRSPEKNASARLHWTQREGQFDIRLSGALGLSIMAISGTEQKALIEIAGQDDIYTSELEQTLIEQTGWDIPLGALLYWVRGIPASSQTSHHQQGDAGQIISMKQAGWNLKYSNYKSFNGFLLPGKIHIRKEDLLLLLIINQWMLPAQHFTNEMKTPLRL